ncbi:hypothetical protein NQ854_21555 [Rhodococcus ruber]
MDFSDSYDILDLLGLQQALEDLLTVRVEIIDGRAEGRVGDRAREEAVAL